MMYTRRIRSHFQFFGTRPQVVTLEKSGMSDRAIMQIRAIVALRKNGWADADIRKALRIGRTTVFRRDLVMKTIERHGPVEALARVTNPL